MGALFAASVRLEATIMFPMHLNAFHVVMENIKVPFGLLDVCNAVQELMLPYRVNPLVFRVQLAFSPPH